MSVRFFVCPYKTTGLLLERFLLQMIFEYFSKICQENTSFIKNLIRKIFTSHEDLYTFMITFYSKFLRTGNVLDKHCGENQQRTIFMSNCFICDNQAFFEIP
jgi:hypothetical protein